MCKRKRDYLEAKSEKFCTKSTSAGNETGGVTSAAVGVPRVTFSAPVVSEGRGGKPVLQLHPLPKASRSSKTISKPGQSSSPPEIPRQGARLVSQSGSSQIHAASGIPAVLSNYGTKSMQHSQSHSKNRTTPPSATASVRRAKGNSADAAKSRSTGKSASRTKVSPPSKSTSETKPHKKPYSPQAARKEDAPVGMGGAKRDVVSSSRLGGESSSDYLSRAASEGYDPQLLEYMEGLERYQTRLSKTKP